MAVTLQRLAPWILRASWVVVGLTVASALDEITPGNRSSFDLLRFVLGAAWVVGAAATTFPAVRTLTVVRVLIPFAVPVMIAARIGGASTESTAAGLIATIVASAVAGSAELGRTFVQASAYGAEERHVLRAPPAYLIAAVCSWIVAAVALAGGGLLVASDRFDTGPLVGGAAMAVGVALTVWSGPRWHRLSRRWLVVVPAGLVIHDHLVLAETLMITRSELDRVTLAPVGTTAADLTGPAAGHALEITTHAPVTAVLAATPDRPGGRAIHLSAALVAPSRPGAALVATTRR